MFETSKERLVNKKSNEIKCESDSDSYFYSDSDNESGSDNDLFFCMFRAWHYDYFGVWDRLAYEIGSSRDYFYVQSHTRNK